MSDTPIVIEIENAEVLPISNQEIHTVTSYEETFREIAELIKVARWSAFRSVDAIMTATYWEVGRHIVNFEQNGKERAEYGKSILKRLSTDLNTKFHRGFSEKNLGNMRKFYLTWAIPQSVTAESGEQLALPIFQSLAGKSDEQLAFQKSNIINRFPLPWTHYVCLLSVKDFGARAFYEQEALKGGWSTRELKRQINTLSYERMVELRGKERVLRKGAKRQPTDVQFVERELKNPYVFEFLNLEDGHSEKDLEKALVDKLQFFLLELGNEFAFVGRQRRLRIDNKWYKIDLLFFHRGLRRLIIIDLKMGNLTYEDVGQMNVYVNYASEHWMYPGEDYPLGLILCAKADKELAHYALGNLENIIAIEHKIELNKETLIAQIEETKRAYGQ